MANTVTVNSTHRSVQQFQGAFSEMWQVTATISDQDAVAINDTLAVNLTVPGVALGDMVIADSLTVDALDAGGDGAVISFRVTAANVLTMYVHADVAEFAADSLNNGVVKVLIGRPAW